jgi:hypothetical protein
MTTGLRRSIFFWKRRFLHETLRRDNAGVVFARGYSTSSVGCLPGKNHFKQSRKGGNVAYGPSQKKRHIDKLEKSRIITFKNVS